MASTSKRQQTMAKRNREQAVKEKAALKLEKKYAAARERQAKAHEEMYGHLRGPEDTIRGSEATEQPEGMEQPESTDQPESAEQPESTEQP
jgi:hypothetical protein